MQQLFEVGSLVRFNDEIVAAAPAYAGKTFEILAASATWEIGSSNEWHGDYVIKSETGEKSVTRQSCLVAA